MNTAENMLREVLARAFDTNNESLLEIADAFEDADNKYSARKTGKNRDAAHNAHKALRAAWLKIPGV